jgi:hypothetical protein
VAVCPTTSLLLTGAIGLVTCPRCRAWLAKRDAAHEAAVAAERAAAALHTADCVRIARAMVADADVRGCIALVQQCDPVRLDVRAPSRAIRDRASDLAASLIDTDTVSIDTLAALLSVQP